LCALYLVEPAQTEADLRK